MGKIDTKSRWLRVVETIPARHEWLDHVSTNSYLVVKPLKTSLALVVEILVIWLTRILNQTNQIPSRLAEN